jgi:pimeloyl-ACP methyl ester carboxylesterase
MESFIYLRHDLTGTMSSTVQVKLGQFLSQLESQLASQHVRKVAIIGHSYGGYTSMLVAKAFSNPGSRIKVVSLTTLDPISMDTCQPQILLNYLVREAPAPGCNEAPATSQKDSHISMDDVTKIAATVPWTNLWQGVDTYLHASPIAVPGIDNQEVIYDRNNKNGFANHFLFVFPADKVNPAWPRIAENVLSKMAGSLN